MCLSTGAIHPAKAGPEYYNMAEAQNSLYEYDRVP